MFTSIWVYYLQAGTSGKEIELRGQNVLALYRRHLVRHTQETSARANLHTLVCTKIITYNNKPQSSSPSPASVKKLLTQQSLTSLPSKIESTSQLRASLFVDYLCYDLQELCTDDGAVQDKGLHRCIVHACKQHTSSTQFKGSQATRSRGRRRCTSCNHQGVLN